jgi:hypothetical protein
MEPQAEPEVDTSYEHARRSHRRAQIWLNAMVVFSACAASVFLVYVLAQVLPRFGGTPEPDLPTGRTPERIGLLQGFKDGLFVELRDIDEAAGYRDELNRERLADLGISDRGRLLLLIIENRGDKALTLTAESIEVALEDSQAVKWLAQAAKAETATPIGRMLLAQADTRLELAAGTRRTLMVFLPSRTSDAPPAEQLKRGSLRFADGRVIELNHEEVTVTR